MRTQRTAFGYLSISIAGAGFVLPSVVAAQQEPAHAIRISGGLEASSNPFLLEQDAEAIAAYISVDPTIFLEEGRNTTVIDGSLRATQYFNDYGTDANGSLRLSTQRALTERTDLQLSASINSTRRSFIDGLSGAEGNIFPADPTALPDAATLDPTLIGALVRSTTMEVTGSLEHRLTPVSFLSGGAAFSRTNFSNAAGLGVSSASGSLSYGRRIAPQTVMSFGGQFASFNFAESELGDANVYALQANVEHEIGTRWRLALGAGVNLVDRDLGMELRDTATLFSGDFGLCNTGLRGRFCITGRRAAQPAAIGGLATVTSIGVSYERQLSQNNTVSFNSQYGRSNQTLGDGVAAAGTVVDVIGGTANFRHDLSDRTALVVAVGYSDVSDVLRDVPANAFVRVGISLDFGRRR